jgi:CDP-4-dehydro-6-deoxyglucose reductase
MPSPRTVELLVTQPLSPTVKMLRFRVLDGAPLAFVAGQWLNFDVTTPHGVVRRAYSIATAPTGGQPDCFEIAVTRVDSGGSASLALHALQPGARLEVDGPHGFFTREDTRPLSALFVGTGTGVCPLRAMVQDELQAGNGPRLALLFGCRSQADILWGDELGEWARQHPRFSLHVTLSRPSPGWAGLEGYVQRHLRELIDPAARPQVYVCGLTKMVTEVRRVLKDELGYDRRMIHSERYD